MCRAWAPVYGTAAEHERHVEGCIAALLQRYTVPPRAAGACAISAVHPQVISHRAMDLAAAIPRQKRRAADGSSAAAAAPPAVPLGESPVLPEAVAKAIESGEVHHYIRIPPGWIP